MARILSQEEVDALLGSARASQAATPARGDKAEPAAVAYNFRRPDRVSKEQIRSIHFLHDRFARNAGAALSAYLRVAAEMSIVSVEQFTYSETLMSFADPTAFYAIALPPLDGLGALEISPAVAFAMIDRMLGGSGQVEAINRSLTEIEQNVVDAVVKVILDNLTEAWHPILPVSFKIHARDTRPQMLQVAAPNDVVILLGFDVKVGDARGMLNVVVPATVGSSFALGWERTRRAPNQAERQSLIDSLARVKVAVSSVLDAQITARDLVSLTIGDVLSLGVPAGDPVQVRIGREAKFTGRIRATDRGVTVTIEERIKPDETEVAA